SPRHDARAAERRCPWRGCSGWTMARSRRCSCRRRAPRSSRGSLPCSARTTRRRNGRTGSTRSATSCWPRRRMRCSRRCAPTPLSPPTPPQDRPHPPPPHRGAHRAAPPRVGRRGTLTTSFRCLAAALLAVVAAPACHRRESLEDSRARATETVLLNQIEDLRKLVAKTESGALSSPDRIAIGITDEASKALLDASLPHEQGIGDRVRVRIEAAQPLVQGNNAALLFRASAHSLRTSAAAHLELGGRLKDFRIEKDKLVSAIELVHFKVLDSSLGDIGSDVLENLVRSNMGVLS